MEIRRSLRLQRNRRRVSKRLRRCLIKYNFMKDWEIRKVNAIYKELDDLRLENTKLRHDNDRLGSLEDKIDKLILLLDKPKTTKTKK